MYSTINMFKKQFDILEGGNKSISTMNMDVCLSKLWIKTLANYGRKLQLRRNIGVYEMTVVESPVIVSQDWGDRKQRHI